jgi:3,4-dihydroxy 2-butanone 4-phosphate synthase/GTP cyclohydrolase II
MPPGFDSIESVLADLKRGRMVIVTDDADRENEGDLVMAAEKVTPAAVNFMARYGRGLVCVPTIEERLRQLGVERMVAQNRESFKTDFQVTVDAARGITTGISAADRARTIQVMADPTATADDLVQPGHVFPLRAKAGGVLQRAGHTEAAVDLARLAGCRPIGVICEIMADSGEMMRLPELRKFARRHRLKLCSIQDLILHRRTREKLVERVQTIRMPTVYGDFDLHLYRARTDGQHHLALVKGDIAGQPDVLVRVHSECLTGDVFGSLRCDCGPQLQQAVKQIAEAGRGVLLYMRQEGREGMQFVAVGGTAAILARIELGLSRYDRRAIEAAALSLATVAYANERLWDMSLAERKHVSGLPAERADIILTGVAVFEAVMRAFRLAAVRPSLRGLRFAAVMDEA